MWEEEGGEEEKIEPKVPIAYMFTNTMVVVVVVDVAWVAREAPAASCPLHLCVLVVLLVLMTVSVHATVNFSYILA